MKAQRIRPVSSSKIPWALGAIWVCFLVRGFFYSSVFPLWEGYDEWAHFAYAQHWSVFRSLPVADQTRISLEVQESLKLVPLPWTLRHYPSPHVTHDAYWTMPEEDRVRRQQEFRSLPREWSREPVPGGLLLYEAQHPPLYYWLLSRPLRVFSSASLPDRVLLLRWLSVAVASLFIPLGFAVARRVFCHDSIALGVVALAALMPELLVNVSRVGNESLAVVLYTLVIYFSLEVAERPGLSRPAVLLGLALGFGLLTKAYFLTAIPALGLVFGWCYWHKVDEGRKILVNAVLASAIAVVVSGWWYWRSWRLSGAWTGLSEDVALQKMSFADRLGQIVEVDWANALDSIFLSHIWFGNWSFLQVRSWMYHLFEYIVLAAILGLVLWTAGLRRKRLEDEGWLSQPRSILVLGALYAFFWLGLAYHVLLIFLSRGVSTSTGWYLYCLVVAEIILATVGLFALCPVRLRPCVLPAGSVLFALLDLYGLHFLLIPYYTGLISHQSNGALASFHISQLAETGLGTVILRLQANKPEWLGTGILLVLWILFLVATLGLVVIAICSGRGKDMAGQGHQPSG